MLGRAAAPTAPITPGCRVNLGHMINTFGVEVILLVYCTTANEGFSRMTSVCVCPQRQAME